MKTNTENTSGVKMPSPVSTAKLVILAVIAILFFTMAIVSHTNPEIMPATFDLNMADSATWQQSNL